MILMKVNEEMEIEWIVYILINTCIINKYILSNVGVFKKYEICTNYLYVYYNNVFRIWVFIKFGDMCFF